MSQKGQDKPKLFDFPIDPTPSLKAYIEFTNHIREYFKLFIFNEGVLSIGPIKLGTVDRPFVQAPIEMDPGQIERYLRPARDILERALSEAQESIIWIRKILEETGSESPEAENRINVLLRFIDEIQKLLDYHKGFAWHPGCYERIRGLFENSFRPGDPGIPVQITIFV